MHKSIQQFFKWIFIRFFLCEVPWMKLETKTKDCLAEGKLDTSRKRILYHYSLTFWDDLIKWSECDVQVGVMAGTEMLTDCLYGAAEYNQTETH